MREFVREGACGSLVGPRLETGEPVAHITKNPGFEISPSATMSIPVSTCFLTAAAIAFLIFRGIGRLVVRRGGQHQISSGQHTIQQRQASDMGGENSVGLLFMGASPDKYDMGCVRSYNIRSDTWG